MSISISIAGVKYSIIYQKDAIIYQNLKTPLFENPYKD